MAIRYKCPECGKTYDTLSQDMLSECHDRPLEPIEVSQGRSSTEPPRGKVSGELMEGLCVLVCDASYSMEEDAFPEEKPDLSKLRLVVDAVQSAVDAMANLSMAKNAYIAIIAFGMHAKLITDRQGQPFIKSVANILAEFSEQATQGQRQKQGKFAAFLQDKFANADETIERRATNITEALQLAKELVDGAMKGDLTQFGFHGRVTLIKHQILTRDTDEIEVPNVRVMIYSDGVQNIGELANPFAGMKPVSVLMTSFIGQPEGDMREGADDLRGMANICPKHGHAGYFLVHKEARGELLRKVFRMATKASGFCTQCALEET